MGDQPAAPRRDPGPVPTDMIAFNRALIEEFRANRGQLSGRMAGRTLMLLTTTGARSAQPRTAVLGFRKVGDDFVVIASGNGAPQDPAWYRNLQKNPNATVEVGAEKFAARASTARGPARARYAAAVDYLEAQQKLTSREIPVVVLRQAQPRQPSAGPGPSPSGPL